MLQKIFHFIKYNNATVIILAIILILGGGALAAGPEAIGQKQVSVQNIDNTLLLQADLENFKMDFKIEKIEQDDNYYYAAYSYLDLVVINNGWQYQFNSQTQKISKKLKQDLGEYLANFLAKHQEARVRQLKQEKRSAESAGEQQRVEITEYTGLIGLTLDLAAKVFPGYEPVVKRQLPAPEFNFPNPSLPGEQADNLTQIYNNYMTSHPDLSRETASSTPETTPELTPETIPDEPVVSETPADSAGSPQAIPEPESVEIIELPAAQEMAPNPEPAAPIAPVENTAPAQ